MTLPRLVLVGVLALAACGNKPAPGGPSSIGDTVAAWQKAGLSVPGLEARPALAGGRCQGATVEGLEVTLCDYGDAARAKAAETAGLALAGETTAVSLARGPLLLVAVDRAKKDPNGKKLNTLAKAFRGK